MVASFARRTGDARTAVRAAAKSATPDGAASTQLRQPPAGTRRASGTLADGAFAS